MREGGRDELKEEGRQGGGERDEGSQRIVHACNRWRREEETQGEREGTKEGWKEE